jgi:hypothetical protein
MSELSPRVNFEQVNICDGCILADLCTQTAETGEIPQKTSVVSQSPIIVGMRYKRMVLNQIANLRDAPEFKVTLDGTDCAGEALPHGRISCAATLLIQLK